MSNNTLSNFLPLERIGEGTYSSVYKVRRTDDGAIYALKKVKIGALKQKQRENALNEVRILASIYSKYVITYKEAFFDERLQLLCIVMEWANQGDLLKQISKKRQSHSQFQEREVWKAALHIASGLSVMHKNSILHRDLKSANIFISSGVYKLGDLNVSKVSSQQRLVRTQTGTPYYASPQIWRDQPYGSKSDIWSFGCVLYEMCSQRPPFYGKDLDQLYKNVQKGTFQSIPKRYSNELNSMIRSCLQKNTEKRPSAIELINKVIKQKCLYYEIDVCEQKVNGNILLSTIKMPSDFKKINSKLPKSKYDRAISQSSQCLRKSQKNQALCGKILKENFKTEVSNSKLHNPSQVVIPTYKQKNTEIPLPQRIKNHLNEIQKVPVYHRKVLQSRQNILSKIVNNQKSILQKKLGDSLANKEHRVRKIRPFSCNPKGSGLKKIQSIKMQDENVIECTNNKPVENNYYVRKARQVLNMQKLRAQSASHRNNSQSSYLEIKKRMENRYNNKPTAQNKRPFKSEVFYSLNMKYQPDKISSSLIQRQLSKIPSKSTVQNNSGYLQQIQNKLLASSKHRSRKCEMFSYDREQIYRQ